MNFLIFYRYTSYTFLENGMNDGDLKLGYIAEHVWKDFEISPLLLNIGGFSFSFESEIIKVFPISQQEQVGALLGLK